MQNGKYVIVSTSVGWRMVFFLFLCIISKKILAFEINLHTAINVEQDKKK